MAKLESSLIPGKFFRCAPPMVHEGRNWRGKHPPSNGALPLCSVLLKVSSLFPDDLKHESFFYICL